MQTPRRRLAICYHPMASAASAINLEVSGWSLDGQASLAIACLATSCVCPSAIPWRVSPAARALSHSLMCTKSYYQRTNAWKLQRTTRVHKRTIRQMSKSSVLFSGVPAQKPFSQLLLKQSHPSSVKQAISGD